MSKGFGSTFSITQQVCQCLCRQTDYSSCFVSSLAQLCHYTYAIPLTVLLQGFTYTCTSITYYILCNRQVPGTLSQVSCPLVASPTERDQPCDLCVTPGGDLWHILYFLQKPRQVKYHCYWLSMSWTSMVTLDLTSLAHHNSPEEGTTLCSHQKY